MLRRRSNFHEQFAGEGAAWARRSMLFSSLALARLPMESKYRLLDIVEEYVLLRALLHVATALMEFLDNIWPGVTCLAVFFRDIFCVKFEVLGWVLSYIGAAVFLPHTSVSTWRGSLALERRDVRTRLRASVA